MRRKFMTFLIFILLTLIFGYTIYDGYNFKSGRIKVVYQNIVSDKIDKDLDNLKIAFISDLYYGEFVDDNRLELFVNTLNNTHSDVVIFLGDLISDQVSDEINTESLEKFFKNINAKFGKFAILGENDYLSDKRINLVESILYNANFEVLKNENINIQKNNKTMKLVAIDSPLNNLDDIEKSFKDIDQKDFTLTIVHTPDTINKIPINNTDLVVAGHSLGGLINIPLLGQVYNKPLAEEYYLGNYNVNNTKLYVTSGLGTNIKDVRLFTSNEILVYTFKAN